jgi:hypothetical protein
MDKDFEDHIKSVKESSEKFREEHEGEQLERCINVLTDDFETRAAELQIRSKIFREENKEKLKDMLLKANEGLKNMGK